MDDLQRYEQGLALRREVLGEAHVSHALQHLNDFNTDFQDLITRFAWGEVWSRPGMSRHSRSLITIAILLALGRNDELRMHLRAGFNNGVTREDLKELMIHCALYAGLPAANAAMHMAEEILQQQSAPPINQ